MHACAEALQNAAELARAASAHVDAVRWESEAAYLARQAGAANQWIKPA